MTIISCSNCGQPMDASDSFCGQCGTKLVQDFNNVQWVGGPIGEPLSYINISPSGEITLYAKTTAEAKLALKELKLKKKEYSLQKRQIKEQQRIIRAEYTQTVRQRGSKFIGGGGIGRIIRDVQTISRDAKRRDLANQLAPYEQLKQYIEAVIPAIDQMILKVEAAMLANS